MSCCITSHRLDRFKKLNIFCCPCLSKSTHILGNNYNGQYTSGLFIEFYDMALIKTRRTDHRYFTNCLKKIKFSGTYLKPWSVYIVAKKNYVLQYDLAFIGEYHDQNMSKYFENRKDNFRSEQTSIIARFSTCLYLATSVVPTYSL